jgi:hypothetical protein
VLGAPVFESQIQFLGGSTLVAAPGIGAGIIELATPVYNPARLPLRQAGPFAGVQVTFELKPTGGTVDTGAVITVYRSFDGNDASVDDAPLQQITIAAADIGESPAIWYQTVMYPAVPGDSALPSCGHGLGFNIAHDGAGDRNVRLNTWYRRWRWKAGL